MCRTTTMARTLVLLSWTLLVGAAAVAAQPPAGYYGSVDTSSASSLRSTLHEVIDDHTRFPYTASTTDTWDILNLADEDPNNTSKIVDLYKNASYTKMAGGAGAYNREHTWPKSYGFPDDGPTNYPYTDTHHLFACDTSYNADRANHPFADCANCIERTTLFNDGRGGGSGVYPGNSNWVSAPNDPGAWETWDGRKGDVARAIFYMDLRYEGGNHSVTGVAEPDLIVTDSASLISSSATGSNLSVAYMGRLSTLLQWHAQDPPDSREIWRNEVIFSFQGNRNPFIDHPEWVACLHSNVCGNGDVTPPGAPTGLVAVAGVGEVSLSWNANSENDLAGYHVYRAIGGASLTRLTSTPITNAFYTDAAVTGGTSYTYVVRAVDTSTNESGNSSAANATPTTGGGGGGSLLLSEVFYDAAGSDGGYEWVELYNAGTSAVNLASSCLGYGGSSYTYGTAQLAGTVAAGATFVVGGTASSATNANPAFDQGLNFNPDIQNAGSTGDGLALFNVGCSSVTGATVPVDAVVYGPNNNSGLIDEGGSASSPEVADAPNGSSIERTSLAGAWQVQSSPTPNATPFGTAPEPETLTFTSIASHDGWVRESSENSNVGGSRSSTSSSTSGLRAGDNSSDRQYKGIVSFDTSAIPSGATIVSATLRLRRGTVSGTNPFNTHGTCWVDVRTGRFGSSTSLANSDFQATATATKAATLSSATSNGQWSEGSLSAAGRAAVNTSGTTQLRFYFDLGDNDDRNIDYVGYYASNNSNTANRPQLVVTYLE